MPPTPIAASICDTAAALGLGKTTLYDLIAAGKGPRVIKIGRRSMILHADRDIWIEQHAVGERIVPPPPGGVANG